MQVWFSPLKQLRWFINYWMQISFKHFFGWKISRQWHRPLKWTKKDIFVGFLNSSGNQSKDYTCHSAKKKEIDYLLWSLTIFLLTFVSWGCFVRFCTSSCHDLKEMKTWLIIAVITDTRQAVVKSKPEKKPHDLCDIGAMLYKLSCQANWEPVTL